MNWLCRRGWHKFRARYDEEPIGYVPKGASGWGFNIVNELRSLMFKDVYVRDICVRCGETYDR